MMAADVRARPPIVACNESDFAVAARKPALVTQATREAETAPASHSPPAIKKGIHAMVAVENNRSETSKAAL
ncbi:hypothetical protein D3C72_2375740 [compost metagenome]